MMADCHVYTRYHIMLVLFLICSGTNSLVYQILPSSHYSCQTQPCLTLSQFASDIGSYLQFNTTLTLIFQPGNHILGVTFRVESMLSLQLSSILPLNATIVCGQSRFELLNIGSVYVGNLKFIGCSVRGELINHLLMEDAMFFGQKKASSALELIRSTVVVNGSSFISNMIGTLKPIMLKKTKNHTTTFMVYVGGAVILTDSNVVFIQSLFKQNSAEVGGAVFCEAQSNITVIDTSFERNHVTSWHNASMCYGGAVYCQQSCYLKLENSTFDSNKAIGSGGAVAAMGHMVRLDINECIFSDNEATNDGGAAYIWKGRVSINNTVFDYNYVNRNGGAVYLEASGCSIAGVIDITKNKQTSILGENINDKSLMNQSQFSNYTALDDREDWTVITLSQFTGNDASYKGGAIYASGCAIDIIWSDFDDNYSMNGGAIHGGDIIITVTESEFSNNVAEDGDGGAFYIFDSIFIINRSQFRTNEGFRGGALSCWSNTTININRGMFDNNIATDGGAVFISTGAISIYCGDFTHNKAWGDAGVLYTYITSVNIKWCNFTFNEAGTNGGAVRLHSVFDSVIVHIKDSVFSNNKADTGGAIFVRESILNINNSDFTQNYAETGVMYVSESNMSLSGNVTLISNTGSLFLLSSKLIVAEKDAITAVSNFSPNFTTTIIQEGGAITSFQSEISIYGECSIFNNNAEKGGALLATESKIFISCGKMLLANNIAADSGGGAYLYQSELNCKNHGTITFLGNIAAKKGGGIHAISSLIKVDHPGCSVHFTANIASAGGGICLEMTAKLYVLTLKYRGCHGNEYAVFFTANSAHYGGAVYVSDETNSGVCDSSYGIYSTLTECFIQTLALYVEGQSHECAEFYFQENQADISGSTLFGGLLDRCTASPFSDVHSHYSHRAAAVVDGLAYFKTISILNNSQSITLPISSHPVRVRFCKDDQPDYKSQSFHIRVEKGRLFKVPLVAVDQANHTINASVHISLSSNLGGLSEDQSLQMITESCTDLALNVFSPNGREELILYARGPCKDAQLSIGQIFIQFLPCTCPIGFQPNETTRCTCECDSKLSMFITECHEHNKTLARVGTFWIAYLNTNNNISVNDYEYLVHAQCPLDYCYPPTSKVYVNLNEEFGSDEQCAFDRSGILCGKCRSGYSLSLGSSRCIKCSVHWPVVCLTIIIVAILAGIALIALLLALNLTVAMGTINGIILYSNIVKANISTFLPFTEPNHATIFIAWLNLELGIDTCFFEGMDMYWKTLLQLVFPLYVIILVVIVIIISERSTKFAHLIGRKNPVATLDTLILLSYSKLLQIIIAALSFTVLEYPDGTKRVVWLPDANISYLYGKHAFLFIVAFIILLGGIAYTTLLFSWQWLMHYQHKSLFKWVRYHQLQLFIEPYHAPYTFKHRYWTGLLLLARVILYLASALNVTGTPAVNLLVTEIVVFTLFILKAALHGPVYRKLPVEFLEASCYVNILILTVANFYTLEAKNGQPIVGYISVTVTIALLCVVLIYHLFTEICSKKCLWKKKRLNIDNEISLLDYQQVEDFLPQPTVSWVDAPQCEQSLKDVEQNEVIDNKEISLTDHDGEVKRQ